jgi:hypothetical protein
MKPSPQIKHYTSQKKYQEYIFKTFVCLTNPIRLDDPYKMVTYTGLAPGDGRNQTWRG